MPTNWTEHKLLDSAIQRFRKALLLRILPIILIAVAIGIYVGLGPEGDPGLAVVSTVVIGAAVGFGAWRGFNRQLDSLRTLEIVVTDEWIARRQQGFTPLQIDFSDIRRILHVRGKGLTVFGQGMQSFITMPEEIEDFESIRSRLEAVHPLEVRARPSLLARLAPLLLILILFAFGVVALSDDKLLVLGLGIPLVVILGSSILMTRRSPQIDERSRKLMWIGLFPLIALIVKMVAVAMK
jgi:hypothetical protein